MHLETIKSPGFQKLQARGVFEFEQLNPVRCNICRSGERDILFMEGVFEVAKCRKCGLVYVTPQPSGSDLRVYYRRFYSRGQSSGDRRWRNSDSFLQAYGCLQRFLPQKNGNILEIGCGYGYFLELIRLHGYTKTTGIEPDESISKACQQRNPEAEIITGDFISHDFKELRFDAIVMLASLEHFSDPLGVLKTCYDLLNAGGLILIRVPCLEGFFRLNCLIKKAIVPFGAPRHLYDFNENTLKNIIQAAGFKTIRLTIGDSETAASAIYAKMIRLISA